VARWCNISTLRSAQSKMIHDECAEFQASTRQVECLMDGEGEVAMPAKFCMLSPGFASAPACRNLRQGHRLSLGILSIALRFWTRTRPHPPSDQTIPR
jgi:hypothetical protein